MLTKGPCAGCGPCGTSAHKGPQTKMRGCPTPLATFMYSTLPDWFGHWCSHRILPLLVRSFPITEMNRQNINVFSLHLALECQLRYSSMFSPDQTKKGVITAKIFRKWLNHSGYWNWSLSGSQHTVVLLYRSPLRYPFRIRHVRLID